MTHPRVLVVRAFRLAEQGLNNCEIAREIGVPRRTISGWMNGKVPRPSRGPHGRPCPGCAAWEDLPETDFAAYAYLLGAYLGDGCISAHPEAFTA